jgi:hypothetical protein
VISSQKSSRGPIEADDPIPWGKYKGIPIEQVPRDYLVWSLKNMDACRPDHERYWPKFRELLESLVGPQASTAPTTLALLPLCAQLTTDGVKLSLRGSNVVTSEPVGPEIEKSIQANRAVITAVLRCTGAMQLGGSARLIQGVELRAMVKAWYGRMSRQFHPDAGGTPVGQTAVNACYKALMELLEQWETGK